MRAIVGVQKITRKVTIPSTLETLTRAIFPKTDADTWYFMMVH
jgi:hypothetical protein